MTMRLPVRLFLSYAAVAVIGGAVAYLTVRLLAPRLFDQQVGMMNGSGNGRGMGMGSGINTATQAGVHDAFQAALNTALIVGVLASIAAAVLLAWFVTRRLLRPLNAVRTATRQIAAGGYDVSVPLPSEPELAALATDVNTLATALADTETRRTRLLGDVAHELRTPLTALDGYVEGLIDGVFEPTPELLGSLSEELRRLHRLADDLSDLSRVQELGLALHPAAADLAELAGLAASRLAPQFHDAQITLVMDVGTRVPVHVDIDRITQVLTNLLGNASAGHSHRGSVTLTALQDVTGVRRCWRPTPGWVCPTRTSRGCSNGSSVHRANRAARPGSGIGLTIARGIARGARR